MSNLASKSPILQSNQAFAILSWLLVHLMFPVVKINFRAVRHIGRLQKAFVIYDDDPSIQTSVAEWLV